MIIEQTQRLKKALMQMLLTKGIRHIKFKNTTIGEIPEEWEVSTIGKECTVGTGGTPSRTKSGYFTGNIPWIKTVEIDFNIITSAEEHITHQGVILRKDVSRKSYH